VYFEIYFFFRYAAEWYLYSPRLKSLLLVTLYRSIVPCNLTAGKLFPLSMSTYAAVSTRFLVYLCCNLYKTIYTSSYYL